MHAISSEMPICRVRICYTNPNSPGRANKSFNNDYITSEEPIVIFITSQHYVAAVRGVFEMLTMARLLCQS